MPKNKTPLSKEFSKGLLKENPVLRLLLGMCPSLAVTTTARNGLGMGLAALFVLTGSSIAVSLLRNVIPEKVRIPSFILIIAGFVSIVQMLLQAFLPALNSELGIFIPLIVVNCIIFARAEMFGNGTLFGLSIPVLQGGGLIEPMLVFILPPGGFFVFGILVALSQKLSKKLDWLSDKKELEMQCGSCNICSESTMISCPSNTSTDSKEEVISNE